MIDRLVHDKPTRQKTLSHYLIKIARFGGNLARASDPPPGNTVMWRGLSRLTDIAQGTMVGGEFVGNSKLDRTDTLLAMTARKERMFSVKVCGRTARSTTLVD
ncbi:hypothetical protein [Bradyrhizobium sp. RT11b]|uniref:hypothetical protein n=1 Tax=Bradyrhizobium sp. RT11b TaxID=3156332 RepID=UPI0033943052